MLNRFPHFEPASYAAFKSNGIAPQPFASSAPQSANGSGRASAANHAIKCRHRPMLNSMTARDRRSCPGLPSSIPINGIRLRWQSADWARQAKRRLSPRRTLRFNGCDLVWPRGRRVHVRDLAPQASWRTYRGCDRSSSRSHRKLIETFCPRSAATKTLIIDKIVDW